MKIVFSYKVILCLFIFSFFVVGNSVVFSQEFNYEKAYQDYIYNYDLYKKAHSEYSLKKSRFEQSGTLASKEDYQNALSQMLFARDKVVITHLTAIRLKLSETKGVDLAQKDSLYRLIDEEVSWYKSHKDLISSAASLEDLQKESNSAGDRYQSAELTIYKSLSLIQNGKLDNIQSQMGLLADQLEAKIGEIEANGDKNTLVIKKWIGDVRGRIVLSQDREIDVWEVINKMRVTDRSKGNTYAQGIQKFSESLEYLRQANSFLKQIVVEIKTAD